MPNKHRKFGPLSLAQAWDIASVPLAGFGQLGRTRAARHATHARMKPNTTSAT